ncbi:MAG: hypothetical protein Q8R96_01465 [Bacteroidota bacterium]|jgi:hypothetical protein|nr:hypothetical protein [Bacteroidota bacterium]
MTTIVINDRTTGAKKMIEFLKTQSYVTIIEEKTPSASLAKSINEAKTGKVTRTKNVADLLEKLKS